MRKMKTKTKEAKLSPSERKLNKKKREEKLKPARIVPKASNTLYSIPGKGRYK